MPRVTPKSRHSPVRRFDDQRRPPVADDARSSVEPEVVVAADVLAGRQRLCSDFAREVRLRRALDGRRLDFRHLLLAQHRLVRAVRRPLEGRQGSEVPHPL